MAEELDITPSQEQFNETYDVMKNALDEIRAEEGEQPEAPTIEATEESVEDEQPEPAADATADVKTPTYKEAETAQQESIDAKADKSEASEEAVSESQDREAQPDLGEEDAEVYGNLKPKAKERFEHWINRAKELEDSNDNLKVSGELQEHIMDSGTSPEQLNWSLQVFRSLNSGSYDESVKALKALDSFADQIGDKLGVNRTSNENASYGDFEDLSKAVDNLEMSEEWASKLASQRVNESAQHQARNDYYESQQQQQEYDTQRRVHADQAYKDITQWENDLVNSDPDYNLKKDHMVEIGQEVSRSGIPPEQWLNTIKWQYNVLSRGMSAAVQSNGNASKRSGPLAPSRTGGGAPPPTELGQAEVTPEFLQAHLEALHNS
jgi:hypothetical protein|tara:strand:+ start:842 stop:1981 length:1140 start_codon:yes stop_codon:yes gene_type:complete